MCRSVRLSGKHTVVKRLIRSGCRLDVSGVGRSMGVLDGVVIVEGEEAVLGVNLGNPIVTNRDFVV